MAGHFHILQGDIVNGIEVQTALAFLVDIAHHGGIAGRGFFLEGEVDILDGDRANGLLGQTVEIAGCPLAIHTFHITEGECAQVRRAIIHGQGFLAPDVFGLTIGIAVVIHIDDHGGQNIVHADVGELNTINHRILATATAGLDTQATVGMGEQALADGEILYAAGHFAAQHHGAMGILHQTVADDMAGSGGLILHAHVHLTGLQRNGIVTHGEADADIADIVAGLGVSTVGIGAVLGGLHGDIVEGNILTEEGMEIPGSRIAAQNTMEADILTLVQENQTGTADGALLHILPPSGILCVAIDDTATNNGDIIEIITANSSKGPSRDWLKIVKTGQARTKIRAWFKKESRAENIELGRAEVERECRRIYKPITDAQIDEIIEGIGKKVSINSAEDFYNTIGFGGLSLSRFMSKIKEEIEKLRAADVGPLTPEEELAKVKLTTVTRKSHKSGGIIIEGDSGYQVKFAKCCNPLPGDRIVGFVTRGFGVSIHKADCPNVIASRGNEDNLARWIRAEWEQTESSQNSSMYEAMIQIVAEDQIGVLAAISMALADMKVSISQINTQALKDGVGINIVVGCRNVSHYDSIVSRVRSLPKIISVRRGFVN